MLNLLDEKSIAFSIILQLIICFHSLIYTSKRVTIENFRQTKEMKWKIGVEYVKFPFGQETKIKIFSIDVLYSQIFKFNN